MIKVETKFLVRVAMQAGKVILSHYDQKELSIEKKSDLSPVTIADKEANSYICRELKKMYPSIPIISEESEIPEYDRRKQWSSLFLVDPLDGTKEFIKKNGEFTVNIAFVQDGKALEGVVYSPVLDVMYYTENDSSYRLSKGKVEKLPIFNNDKTDYRLLVSRSHPSDHMQDYLQEQKALHPKLVVEKLGSSLKFCRIAEGSADLYPRFNLSMEWDTAAAQAIVEKSGKAVLGLETNGPLVYNKENLKNPGFIVS